jgi:hypothetical protein
MGKALSNGKSNTLTFRCSDELKNRIIALQTNFYPEMSLSEIAGMCMDIGEKIESQGCAVRGRSIKEAVANRIESDLVNEHPATSGKYTRKKVQKRSNPADDIKKVNNDK